MTNKYFGYYDSPIGIVEIISSDNEVLSAMFVEQAGYETEIPEILKEAISQFDEYFKGTRKEFDFKIKLDGTVFQNKVWNELVKIPFGETLSYKELAIKIGNEKATRAVGNANGKNIISIIVPCHRVIGSNKSLTGYAGGLNRKQWLLRHENNFRNK